MKRDAVLQRIAASSVERIELTRGGVPGIDMRGRAVVANVILKPAPTTARREGQRVRLSRRRDQTLGQALLPAPRRRPRDRGVDLCHHRPLASDDARPPPIAAVPVSEVRGEGFGQATWHRSDALTVDGTLRVELSRIARSGALTRARGFVYSVCGTMGPGSKPG